MTATGQDVTMWAGDTKALVFTITDGAGVAINLSGSTVHWIMQHSLTDSVALLEKHVGSGITLTDAEAGILTVTLAAKDTEGLAGGNYYHELEITDSSGDISTVAIGTITMYGSAA